MYFPLDIKIPLLRAAPAPRLGCLTSSKRGSLAAYSSMILSDPSVEPSSMQMTCSDSSVWADTLSRHWHRYFDEL